MNVIISGIQSVYEDVYLLVFQGISKKKKIVLQQKSL